MEKSIIIALGGNALVINKNISVEGQFSAMQKAVQALIPILKNEDYEVVITHGNGPQSGLALMKEENYGNNPLPLNLVVAATQGTIGSMLKQVLTKELKEAGVDRSVIIMVTHVEVDSTDPAMLDPTKFVGPGYSAAERDVLSAEKGWKMKYYKGAEEHCWRRVVPSPKPIKVIEANPIYWAMAEDSIVIACGGGGIPINENWDPIDAVVDKDFASAQLGKEIDAEMILILTAVDQVCIDYGKETEKKLSHLTISEAKKYLKEGQFPAGSMGPKIQAAIDFLEGDEGEEVIITSLEKAGEALEGKTGTRITK